MNIPESDWKIFRSVYKPALERYCTGVLDEIKSLIADETQTAHESTSQSIN